MKRRVLICSILLVAWSGFAKESLFVFTEKQKFQIETGKVLSEINRIITAEHCRNEFKGSWCAHKLSFRCLSDGVPRSGYIYLKYDPNDYIISSNSSSFSLEKEANLSGTALLLSQFIQYAVKDDKREISSIQNIAISWRGSKEGLFIKGYIPINSDGSIGEHTFGSL